LMVNEIIKVRLTWASKCPLFCGVIRSNFCFVRNFV
jgi:hypothetical protein